MEKFKKNTICGYCESNMESQRRSKIFCSSKCRVYFKRENKESGSTKTKEKSYPIEFTYKKSDEKDSAIPPMPLKNDFADSFDFAVAKMEWKKKYG